jgi:phosphate transport system substrate-binding protein
LNLAALLRQINSDYQSVCSGVNVTLGGSTDRKNLNAVQQNQAALAACELTALQQRNLTDHLLAASLYALIASPDVEINGLNSAQVQAIYQGQITNWSQVGGSNEAISVILRPSSDAINAIFRSFVLNGVPVHVRGFRLKKDTPDLVVQAVSQVTGAISIVPLVAVQGAHVQVLAINSVMPTVQSLLNGSYAFWSVEHLYTQGTGTAQAQSYLQFIGSGQEASVMVQLDTVPVRAIP